MSFTRFSKYKPLISHGFLGLLLVSLLLPFLVTYPGNDRVATTITTQRLICTAAGFTWVSVTPARAPDTEQDKTPAGKHSNYNCVLCYFADHLSPLDTTLTQVLASANHITNRLVINYRPFSDSIADLILIRGPPT